MSRRLVERRHVGEIVQKVEVNKGEGGRRDENEKRSRPGKPWLYIVGAGHSPPQA